MELFSPKSSQKYFEISALSDVFELMRRVSQDGSGLTGIAIDEDECGTLDAVVPLPIDRKRDIGLCRHRRS